MLNPNNSELLVAGARDSDRTIFRDISGAIARGELVPGSRLPTERSLAETYGVSRKLVRAALDRLVVAGKIERKVGAGTFVRDPDEPETPEWLSEVPNVSPMAAIEARRVIEVGCVELAVARATDEDLDRLEECLQKMEAETNGSAFRAAAFAFHMALVQATHNPLLASMYELLIAARAKAGWNRLNSLVDTPELRARSCKQGRSFLAALRERDGVGAAKQRYENLTEILFGLMTRG